MDFSLQLIGNSLISRNKESTHYIQVCRAFYESKNVYILIIFLVVKGRTTNKPSLFFYWSRYLIQTTGSAVLPFKLPCGSICYCVFTLSTLFLSLASHVSHMTSVKSAGWMHQLWITWLLCVQLFAFCLISRSNQWSSWVEMLVFNSGLLVCLYLTV